MAGQIKTYGTNQSQDALYPVLSKPEYQCANSSITRGVTGIPGSIDECFRSFPGVAEIAEAVGFYNPNIGGSGYTLWTGASGPPSINLLNTFQPIDGLLDSPPYECEQIVTQLGSDWLGCIWGTPEASYSCTCPDIGPKFEAYIRLRLNSASFWNTPVETPVKRAEFSDAIKYGRKAEVTIAGDFSLRLGTVVNLNVNSVSGYPYSSTQSVMNGSYYITGIKHVVTNSGTHESALSLTQIAPDTSNTTGAYFP